MQFTVLIEFLVPGLATSALVLFLWSNGTMPQLPQGFNLGDTITALILLAVSYPVGILTNFPIYKLIQTSIINNKVRRRILEDYNKRGLNLTELVSNEFSIPLPITGSNEEDNAKEIFSFIRAFTFSQNIERLNSNHLYHEALQRLGRGMFIPLILASIVFIRHAANWRLLIFFCFLFALFAGALIVHSIKTAEEQHVRFFIALRHAKKGNTRTELA